MKINKDILLRVAKNTRLNLNEKEIKELLPQLEQILEHFSVLDKINTSDIEPAFQPIEIKNVLREDKIGKCLERNDVLANVKNKKDGFFINTFTQIISSFS